MVQIPTLSENSSFPAIAPSSYVGKISRLFQKIRDIFTSALRNLIGMTFSSPGNVPSLANRNITPLSSTEPSETTSLSSAAGILSSGIIFIGKLEKIYKALGETPPEEIKTILPKTTERITPEDLEIVIKDFRKLAEQISDRFEAVKREDEPGFFMEIGDDISDITSDQIKDLRMAAATVFIRENPEKSLHRTMALMSERIKKQEEKQERSAWEFSYYTLRSLVDKLYDHEKKDPCLRETLEKDFPPSLGEVKRNMVLLTERLLTLLTEKYPSATLALTDIDEGRIPDFRYFEDFLLSLESGTGQSSSLSRIKASVNDFFRSFTDSSL